MTSGHTRGLDRNYGEHTTTKMLCMDFSFFFGTQIKVSSDSTFHKLCEDSQFLGKPHKCYFIVSPFSDEKVETERDPESCLKSQSFETTDWEKSKLSICHCYTRPNIPLFLKAWELTNKNTQWILLTHLQFFLENSIPLQFDHFISF